MTCTSYEQNSMFTFCVKGREVTASFTSEANFQLVQYLKEILLGDTKQPAYKAAARTELPKEHTLGFDMDSVRKHIPAEIPLEEMADYTAHALEYYRKSFPVHPASIA